MASYNKNPNKKELRDFGLLLGGITAPLFGLVLPWLFGRSLPSWPWVFGAVVLTWALALPQSLKPLYLVWMAVGAVLGWINTRIILTVMFFLVILPTGLIMRLTGKDPMARSFSDQAKSYRTVSSGTDPKQMERPF